MFISSIILYFFTMIIIIIMFISSIILYFFTMIIIIIIC